MNILLFCENYRKGGLDTFLVNLISEWPDDNVFLMINESHEGIEGLKSKLNKNIIVLNLFSRHNFMKGNSKRNKVISIFNFIRKCFLLFVSYPIILVQLISLFNKYKNMDELMVVNGGYPGGESCNMATIAWYLVKRKKSWYNFHNNAQPYRRLTWVLQSAFDSLLSKLTLGFISVSQSCLDSLRVRSSINTIDTRVVLNGISPPPSRLSHSDLFSMRLEILDSHRKRIVMLSTFEERKGHEFIFSVMKLIPQYDLLVCGAGNEYETERIKSLSSELENVHLLGFRNDGQSIIASSDLLIVPSKENESFGLTIIEAMALNTAVIATNVGGMTEVINHGFDGLLSDYGDVTQLKNSILSILEDDEYRNKLTANAKESFNSKYRANVMALNYKNIICKESK